MRKCSASENAIAYIKGGKDAPCLSGEVRFSQRKNFVLIVASVKNLPKTESGFFGFHIHEGSSCSGTDFEATKGHFNPDFTDHPNHAGDMPPLLYVKGGAYLAFTTDRFTVNDIIGRTVVIHSGPDDFTTQPAGNAGKKIGCGEIVYKRYL